MQISLRDHQKQAIKSIQEVLKQGYKRPLLCMPCGSGKTITASFIMQEASKKHNESLFLVDRVELLEQTDKTLANMRVDTTHAKTGKVLTVGNRLEQYNPKIIIVDEANGATAKTWRKVIDNYPKAIVIGLSATPTRLDGTPLSDIFDCIIQPITVNQLIELGLLSKYKYFSITHENVNFAGLKRRAGDFKPEDIYNIMGREVVCSNIIEQYTKLAHNRKSIVFCSTIKHSELMAESFKKAGYAAEHIDAKTPKTQREEIVERFRTGETQILCNVNICTYGFDVPDCDCSVLLTKTESFAKNHQATMRCLRASENKTALILDFVANVETHGLPDTDIFWDLGGKVKKAENEISIKNCPYCFSVLLQAEKFCPYCTHDFAPEMREQVEKERIEVELRERTAQLSNAPYGAYKGLRTWVELNDFRKAKKYNIMWAIRKAQELGLDIPPKYHKLELMVR